MNRRDILKSGLASSVISVFPIGTALFRNSRFSMLEQPIGDYTLLLKHGQAGKDERFYFCVCNVFNHVEKNERIAEILRKNGYRSRLTYSSNDRHKIKSGLDVLEFVAKSEDIQIEIFEILSSEVGLSNIKPTEYVNKVGNITKACLEENSNLQLLTKQEGSFAYSNFAKDSFASLSGKEIVWANPYNDKLMQALDLVTGCMYADLANKNLEASAKIELRNAARKTYGVDSFSLNIDSGNLKIRRLKI